MGLGLLADPAPGPLHRGFGILVLGAALLLDARTLRLRVLALVVTVLGLATQTPLAPTRVRGLDATALRAAAARSGTACDLAGIHEELLRRGAGGLDLALARNLVGDAWGSGSTSPLALDTALRLGVVDETGVRAILSRPECERLFDARQARLALVLPEHAAFVRVLVASRTLKDLARKNLSNAILEAMPDKPRTGALAAFASGCRILDLLPGAADRDDLRARAHALLAGCWVPPSAAFVPGGGFGDEVEAANQRPRFATLATTRQGCEIARRFGLPAHVQGAELRSLLEARLAAELRFFRRPGLLASEAALALAHLETLRIPRPPLWVSERDTAGALCIAAVALLRRRLSGRRSGAPARGS